MAIITRLLAFCLISLALGSVKAGYSEMAANPAAAMGLTPSEVQWLKAHPRIRIGVDPAYAPYSFQDDDGHYRGIAIEFVDYLGAQLGIVLEVVPDLDWPEIVSGVRERRLDVVATMSHRPERETFVNFTEIYLPTPLVIMRRSGGVRINSVRDLDGRTVAMVEGYSASERVREEHPDAKPLMAKTALEGLFAVATGKADAYVGVLGINLYLTQENGITNLEVASLYGAGTNGQRFGVRKDWPELARILDKALAAMTEGDKRQLFERWLPMQAAHPPQPTSTQPAGEIALTPEERVWLAEHPVIRVSSERDYAPIDFQESGQPAGYSIDYVRLLAERLGIRIEFVQDTWSNLLEKAQRRQLDLVHTIFQGSKERETYLKFTRPYKQTVDAIITRQEMHSINTIDDLKGQTVALVTGDLITGLIRQQFPDIQVVEVVDYQASLTAVAFGQADATIIELPVAAYIMRTHLLTNLKVAAELKEVQGRDTSYRLAVRKDWPELISILEKAMDSVLPEEMAALDNRWLILPEDATAQAVMLGTVPISQVGFVIRMLAIVFSVILVSILAFWFIRGRPKQLSIRETLFLISFVFAAFIVTIGTLVTLLIDGEKEQTAIENHRFDSYALAQELKQSSDDLTLFSRAYAVTEDSKYETYFTMISEIRDGLRPHPINFSQAYWDHVSAGTINLNEDGETYTIENRMKELGLSDEEAQKLRLAKKESDDLINFERVAMNAVKGKFQDTDGSFTIVKEPDLKLARMLLYGQKYHDAKSRIMKHIDAFIILLKGRTTNELNYIRSRNNALLLAVSILIGITIAYSVFVFFLLKQRVVAPLRQLEDSAIRVGKGGKAMVVDIEGKNEISQLAEAFNYMLGERNKTEATLLDEKEKTEQALEDLERQESRYRSLVDNIPGAVYRCALDEDWTFYYISDYIEQITGYPPSDFIDNKVRSYASIIHPDDADMVTQAVLDGVASDGYYTIEYRIIGRQGDIHWTYERGQVIRTATGKVDYLDGFIMEITERKQAENDLQQAKENLEYAEARQRAILDNMVDAVITINQGGVVQSFSQSAEKIFGYAADEVIGNKFSMLLPMKIAAEHDSYLQRYIQGGKPRTIGIGREVTARRKDGAEFAAELSVAELWFNEERIFSGIVRDITEKKKLDQAILKAKDDAEAANRAKSIFLSNMSHEIRTPMNAILGYSQIMQHDESLSRVHLRNLRIINRSGDHLLDLINDVLEMSKIEAGRIDLATAPFDPYALIQDVEMMFRLRCEEKRLNFVVEKDPYLPRGIEADEGKVRQVLINLLGNAVKFTPSGEIRLKTWWQNGDALDDRKPNMEGCLICEVSDTGPGVPKRSQKKIFGAFEQTDSGRRVEGGTGLGLAISRRYARMMGGDITVQSDLGQGSVFRFEMTAVATDSIAPSTDSTDRGAVLGLKEGQTPPRILVVDDGDYNVDILTQMLVRVGFEVTPAFSGQEAVDQFSRWRPQAVLMDIRMPVMDGVEATKRIRDLEKECALELPGSDFCHTVIFAVSASALENQRKEIMQEGLADEFISKPFKEADIFERLRKHLGIEYIYQDITPKEDDDEADTTPEMISKAVANLPESLHSELCEATINLDVDRINKLIEKVASLEADLAKHLRRLVDSFDFEMLGRLLEDT